MATPSLYKPRYHIRCDHTPAHQHAAITHPRCDIWPSTNRGNRRVTCPPSQGRVSNKRSCSLFQFLAPLPGADCATGAWPRVRAPAQQQQRQQQPLRSASCCPLGLACVPEAAPLVPGEQRPLRRQCACTGMHNLLEGSCSGVSGVVRKSHQHPAAAVPKEAVQQLQEKQQLSMPTPFSTYLALHAWTCVWRSASGLSPVAAQSSCA